MHFVIKDEKHLPAVVDCLANNFNLREEQDFEIQTNGSGQRKFLWIKSKNQETMRLEILLRSLSC